MMISDVPMPTTEHRHHIPGEPNNLSHWSLLEQLERAWLEFLAQHESMVKLTESKASSQTENFNVESAEALATNVADNEATARKHMVTTVP
jgi:hypothetical protein